MKIGAQVKKVRERALLTQQELAARAGIGLTTLNRIENDRAEPHFRTIRKLAKALGVDPAEYQRPPSQAGHPLHSRVHRRASPLRLLFSPAARSSKRVLRPRGLRGPRGSSRPR